MKLTSPLAFYWCIKTLSQSPKMRTPLSYAQCHLWLWFLFYPWWEPKWNYLRFSQMFWHYLSLSLELGFCGSRELNWDSGLPNDVLFPITPGKVVLRRQSCFEWPKLSIFTQSGNIELVWPCQWRGWILRAPSVYVLSFYWRKWGFLDVETNLYQFSVISNPRETPFLETRYDDTQSHPNWFHFDFLLDWAQKTNFPP